MSLVRVSVSFSTALFTKALSRDLIYVRTWVDLLVGAGRFELPVSCSQSRRASHYATPRGVSRKSKGSSSHLLTKPDTFIPCRSPSALAGSTNGSEKVSERTPPQPNPCGCSSMVEPQPSKLAMPVRSRSPAPVFTGANQLVGKCKSH